MLKLPSLIKETAVPFSSDSAFIQLPEDATDEQRKEHAHKWKVARETGEYGGLRLEGGGEPTWFNLRPLSGDAFAYMTSLEQGGSPPADTVVLAFRYCLRSVTNLKDADIGFEQHPRLGQIATLAFLDKLGAPAAMTVAISLELGRYAIEKASIRPS